jgi:FkbM family methyltransferase
VRPGLTVYDIGANAGFYTLFFSSLVGDSGGVFAFEPCPYVARFLVDHVQMNRLSNVRIIQAAVSQKAELMGMSFDRGMSQNQLCSNSTLMVPTISLDTVGLPAPSLIKIDVEGAESAVLDGALRILQEARPVVFVALHSLRQREKCAALLGAAGFAIHDLEGQLVEGAPETDEIYAVPASNGQNKNG